MAGWMTRWGRGALVGLLVLAVHGAVPVSTQQAIRTEVICDVHLWQLITVQVRCAYR